jgi:phosphoglycerate dehydrogenase-like enzyme
LLVNIARGGLIDQAVRREALLDGRIGDAGLDVTDPGPLPEGEPLWSSPNLIISPISPAAAAA